MWEAISAYCELLYELNLKVESLERSGELLPTDIFPEAINFLSKITRPLVVVTDKTPFPSF